jgi:hypothetical protein
MMNLIIDGICTAINSEFGDEYEIYTESVEQGLEEPSFAVVCLNPSVEQFLGKKYFRTNQFCIHYFPSSNEQKNECFAVMERLFNAMEVITVDDDSIRGTEMRGEVTDDVLHFFVDYNMFVYKESVDEPFMEILDVDTDVKG